MLAPKDRRTPSVRTTSCCPSRQRRVEAAARVCWSHALCLRTVPGLVTPNRRHSWVALHPCPPPHRLDKVTTTRAMTECLPRPINQDTLPLPTLQRFHQQRHPLHRGQKPSPSPKTSCVSGSAARWLTISVAVAEHLARQLSARGLIATARHRELDRLARRSARAVEASATASRGAALSPSPDHRPQ